MTKYYFLAIMLGFSLVLNAQKVEKPQLSSNPNRQKFIQKSELNSSKSILKIFSYDNNEISSGIGISGSAYSLGVFIELPVNTLQPYIGKTIDYIRFGIDNNSIVSSVKLTIYEGNLDATPVITQSIDAGNIISGWNQFKLDKGYTIVSEKTIFVGVLIETNGGGYTITYDTDAASHPNLSGHTMLNGAYYGTLFKEIGIDADYNIQALITDGLGVDYTDLAIIEIKPSTEGCAYSPLEILKVAILNKGDDTLTAKFNIIANINGIDVFQPVDTAVFYPNVEKIVNLPAIDMSIFGVYNIHSSIDFIDATPENNDYSTSLLSGDAVLKIELFTDAFPEDTDWKLLGNDGNIIAQSGIFEAETAYSTELCIISSQCYTWVISDLYGDGMTGEGNNPGTFNLYYNDSIIATNPKNSDFGYEFNVYGIGEGCYSNDIILTHIELPTFELPQALPIIGTIYNNGTDTLKSFEVRYSVDNDASSVYKITGISIPIGNSYEFTHDVPFTFVNEKAYQIEVTVLNPNIKADEYFEDNLMVHKLVINTQVQPKMQLIEHFTSSTNDECFTFTPLLDEMLAGNFENYSLIRYQTNWPEPGDPYYINQTGDRVNYYGVNTLPALYRNGMYNMNITQDAFDGFANQKTIFSINASASYSDNIVLVHATINTVASVDSGLKLHIAIIENNTFGNLGTNGEIDFYNVLMQMIPGAEGSPLNAIESGNSSVLSVSFDMTNTFVEEMNDLSAVIFLQDNITKEVLQSFITRVVLIDNVHENTSLTNGIYPNPFTNSIIIDNLQIGSKLLITNIMGQCVISINTTRIEHEINTKDFKSGIYFVTITDCKNNVHVRKIVKS